MKLDLGLGSFKFAIDTKQENKIPSTWLAENSEQEIGGTGTPIYSGMITKDYNLKLTGREALLEYDKMRLSDGQVQACLLCMKLPLLSVNWRIEPANQTDPIHKEIAEFVEKNLFKTMSISWDDTLRQVLLMLDFGFSNFEKVFIVDKGQIVYKKLAPRLPTTSYQWIMDKEMNLTAWKQQVTINNQSVFKEIPIEKLVIFNINQEGQNFEGRSVLRSAWKHWWIKDTIYRIANIGIEKNAVGTPIITMPSGATAQDKTKAGEIAQSIRAHNKAYAVLPNGFTMDIKAGDIKMNEIMEYVQHHDTKIATSMLAQFINLGQEGGGGAYSLSADSTSFFLLSLNSVARRIENIINRFVIPQLVKYNYAVDEFPTIKCGEFGARDKSAIATALKALVDGNLIQPDFETEKFLRNQFNLPEIDEEKRQAMIDQEAEKKAEALKAQQNKVNGGNGGNNGDGSENGDNNGDISPVKKAGKAIDQENEDGSDDGEDPAEPKLKECPHCHHNIRLADGWRRDLTVWEKEVNLKEINSQFNTYEEKFAKEAKAIVGAQSEKIISDIQKIIESGEWSKLRDLSVAYQGKYGDKLKSLIGDLYDFGMKSVAKDKGKKTPSQSKFAQTWINTKAQNTAEYQAGMLKSKSVQSAMDAYSKGKSPKEILWAVRNEIQDFATRDLSGLVSAVVGDAINEGRYETADSLFKDGIVNRAQYSAILDDSTCDLCERLDGQIIDMSDPAYEEMSPPQHYNCRCIWVYIDTDASGAVPDWSGAPKSIVDKYSTF